MSYRKIICLKQNIYQTLWKQKIQEEKVNVSNIYAFSVLQIYLGQNAQ